METALGMRLLRSLQGRTEAGLGQPRPQSVLTDFALSPKAAVIPFCACPPMSLLDKTSSRPLS